MILEITTTHRPAGDLGYLLHKHPGRVQTFSLAFGKAHVFYPELAAERCTAALVIDVDPVGLVRGKGSERTLDQYVNDRPYVASSMMAVAIAQVFGTALAGNCRDRPELVTTAIPLAARIGAIPCHGGEELLRKLFEPLGYVLTITAHPLDEHFVAWGASSVFTVEIAGTKTLTDLLSHLYVLIPVLDNEKHYWVGDDEVAKLLRHGEGWLAAHPEKELIATRYLKYRRNLANDAIKQLREQDGEGPEEIDADSPEDPREEAGEKALSLHQQRHGVVLSVLQAKGARRVIDLGCGEGKLVRELLKHRVFEKVVGMDVAHRTLEVAADRLRLERLPPAVRQRVELFHGSLMYRDARLEGFDAAVLCEVIEHLDEPRLAAMERVVFGSAKPGIVIVTTPNSEYNVMWETLAAGAMRHRDHRFEWTREQFRAWAAGVCVRFGYSCEFRGVGETGVTPDGKEVGTPTQMGVFSRAG
ncbi:MAG: 3' terminal RNA ribose 2'-O-methyltransferase Hen1 [Phycisphaerales bacterium]